MRLNGPYAFFYLFLGLGLVGTELIKLKMKRRVLGCWYITPRVARSPGAIDDSALLSGRGDLACPDQRIK
jgi:hypothetical protein